MVRLVGPAWDRAEMAGRAVTLAWVVVPARAVPVAARVRAAMPARLPVIAASLENALRTPAIMAYAEPFLRKPAVHALSVAQFAMEMAPA